MYIISRGIHGICRGIIYACRKSPLCYKRSDVRSQKILYAIDYFAILVNLTIRVVTFIGFGATFSGSITLMRCFAGLMVILGLMETIVFYKGKFVFTRKEFQEAAYEIFLPYKYWCMWYCGPDCREKIVQDAVESFNKTIVCLGDIGIGIIVLQLIAVTGAYFFAI